MGVFVINTVRKWKVTLNSPSFENSIRKRGISLIEAVLYLVIALSVIVGGIVFFQQAQLSNQITDTARMSTGVSSQVRGLFQNQRDFGTDQLTAAMVKSGAVPSNFVSITPVNPYFTEDEIVLPFGGNVEIFGQESYFVMQFNRLPKAACLRLMSVGIDGSGSVGTGITGLSIRTQDGSFGQAVPISASDLGGACKDRNQVSIQFSRDGGGEYVMLGNIGTQPAS
ncbi:hypothetical protein LCGC14_0111780 [marine sediment metagenome]|uniref:Prepilin-type N-terminal cleavage/methylation domain-containing protein n=2 Tax=root TaxID=1 RepID=A0A7V1BE17_9RHOB|nr:hypothetical protein [Sulfitobacter litoralis]HDZ51552.1 hypothetical protein [Sulfitobacter litoralis]